MALDIITDEYQDGVEISNLLSLVELLRIAASREQSASHQARMGQYFTPAPVAHLMASLFAMTAPDIHLLDAGAGVGSLFAACVGILCEREHRPHSIHVTAYELDEDLIPYLKKTMTLCRQFCERAGITFDGVILPGDFLKCADDALRNDLFSTAIPPRFNVAILNPPYKKINIESDARRYLRGVGIETSNLYTGFLATAIQLLLPDGEMVAITPRSFCNGLYFKPFRKFLLANMTLRGFYLFDTRDQAFRDDEVLQETIIFRAVKSPALQSDIIVMTASDAEDRLPLTRTVPFTQVVHPDDKEQFIRIIADGMASLIADRMNAFTSTLADLGLTASTGRVVDFRATPFLRAMPEVDTVPLIYPTHFDNGAIRWPRIGSKKPNAIIRSAESEDLLVPNGCYVLVKRFSSKEERRRIVAAVFDETAFDFEVIGFENHLNYFHCNGQGINPVLARGLAAYLNSTLVDAYFRQFSGHTQVNATDLRSMRFPTAAQLIEIGQALPAESPSQDVVDKFIERILIGMVDEEEVDPIAVKRRVEEAMAVLKALGLPKEQCNERSALTLLALLDLKPTIPWSLAQNPLMGITPIMDYLAINYGKKYAPNTRESVRRFTVHQFVEAAIVLQNPDDPSRPTNSMFNVYQVEASALALLREYGQTTWDKNLAVYLSSRETLRTKYAREREMARIPVKLPDGSTISLSAGGQNILIKEIIEEFGPRFTPDGRVLYVGDTGEKFACFDKSAFARLGIEVNLHGKMPDVVIEHTAKEWIVLIEAVTSHGPIDPKRRGELISLFQSIHEKLVFVTALSGQRYD